MSVALLRDETLLGECFLNIEKNHGETLLPAVSSVLERAGVTIRDVGLFVVTLVARRCKYGQGFCPGDGYTNCRGLDIGNTGAESFELACGCLPHARCPQK